MHWTFVSPTEARVSARHATAWGHAWDVFGIFRTDLAGTLPRQRYSTLGGIGTVPTVRLRSLRGPRLLYVEATYAVPLLGLATLGGLDVFARGSGGAGRAGHTSTGAAISARNCP